jgi:hypothetical protein
MSDATSKTAAGLFVQTFATTILPKHRLLPDLTLLSISREPDASILDGAVNLAKEFTDRTSSPEKSDIPELQLRDLAAGDMELVKMTLVQHLKAGAVGEVIKFPYPGPPELDLPNYPALAAAIFETAEIPVRNSPLKGTTLAALVSSSSSISILEVAHSGVTATEAIVSVLFIAGTMIVLGAANAVRRAIEAGLEHKLLLIFGVAGECEVGNSRNTSIAARHRRRRSSGP